MANDKVFVGKVETKEFANGGQIIKIALSPDHQATLQSMCNEKGWVTILVRQSQKGGWYAEVDQWKPNNQQQPPQNRNVEDAQVIDDLPF